jgi:hypothetical protein
MSQMAHVEKTTRFLVRNTFGSSRKPDGAATHTSCHKPTNAAQQGACIGADNLLNYMVGKC